MHKTLLAIIIFSSAIVSITGCSHGYYPFLYRPPLAQGNIIGPANFALLKPGMNKAEVINIVGQPILQTPFSPDEWHYVYTLRKNGKKIKNQQMTLYFNNDILVRTNGN